MKFRKILIVVLSSSLILSSCGLAPNGHMGGRGNISVHGGGGNPAALIIGIVIGTIISTLPDKHTSVSPNHYFADGVFYRDSSHGYEIITAPIGVWVDQIPAKHKVVRYQGRDHFEYQGTWYQFDQGKKQYQVVTRPTDLKSS